MSEQSTQGRRLALGATLLLALAGCATPRGGSASLPPQARYVAMGSSFAAGPGVTVSADTPKTRCARSADNYAHQLARSLDLALTDVSCSGATTANILGSWNELPPQIDAVTPETRLVTITIGGNDVGYIGGLMAASCRADADARGATGRCSTMPAPTEERWTKLATALRRIAEEVRRRAPNARILFVDYLTVLPERGSCALTPLRSGEADASRAIAARLAAVTAKAAQAGGAEIVRASALSKRHDACAPEPWATGFPAAPAYHPNHAGMTAIAEALRRRLQR